MEQVSANYISLLFEYANQRGIDESSLRVFLKDKELDICNPESVISQQEFENAFGALYYSTEDNLLGLRFGSYLNLKALGLIHEISKESSSLRQCVFILGEYFKHTFPVVQLVLEDIGDHLEIQFFCSLNDNRLKTQLLDSVLSFAYREISQLVKSKDTPEVYSTQSYISDYVKHLGANVKRGENYAIKFKSPVDQIVINQGRLKMIELLLPQYLLILNKKIEYGPFSKSVREIILKTSKPELPTFEQVAQHFPMSERTIQRRLRQENQSFRKVLDEIKMELASFLSKEKLIRTQDIAQILGYSESSAFLHALKRWRKSGFIQ